MTNRDKFNALKSLVNEKGDNVAKILVEIAENELEFLDKQFIDKNRDFSKTFFDIMDEGAGIINKEDKDKLLKLINRECENPGMIEILMIMDIFLIVRSTYEFGDALHKAYPTKYEYEKGAEVEELFGIITNRSYQKDLH